MSRELQNFYTKLYLNEHHDSPEKTRTELIRALYKRIHEGIPSPYVLNVASGPQSLEKQMRTRRTEKDIMLLTNLHTFTLDLASIKYKKLMAQSFPNVNHIQGDGLLLPFQNSQFGLVYSNMGIDFIPRTTKSAPYKELARVTSTGGFLFLNCHHPRLIDVDYSNVPSGTTKNHWEYLYSSKMLFQNQQDVQDTLVESGYTPLKIQEKTDTRDTWWFITAQKSVIIDE